MPTPGSNKKIHMSKIYIMYVINRVYLIKSGFHTITLNPGGSYDILQKVQYQTIPAIPAIPAIPTEPTGMASSKRKFPRRRMPD